jgi:flagellar motility protein MotE (MotC chaperone)
MTEKEVEQQPANEAPKAKANGKSQLLPIAVGAIAFVLAVAIFSLKFGVFSSSNVKETEAPAATADSTKHQEEAPEEAKADPYQELFDGYDGSVDEGIVGDTAIVRDSIQKSAWFADQQKDLDRKLAQMELEKTQLNQLKSQVEALMDRKKAMEEGNIMQMAKLYEGMNTEELVPILNNLDDSQVSVMISKMKKQKASEVLGKMAPERAAKITQYIISMNN